MLPLASAEGPDFLHLTPVPVESVVVDALDRWGHTPRHWRLGLVAETTVLGDRDRLAVALDALLENAVAQPRSATASRSAHGSKARPWRWR